MDAFGRPFCVASRLLQQFVLNCQIDGRQSLDAVAGASHNIGMETYFTFLDGCDNLARVSFYPT